MGKQSKATKCGVCHQKHIKNSPNYAKLLKICKNLKYLASLQNKQQGKQNNKRRQNHHQQQGEHEQCGRQDEQEGGQEGGQKGQEGGQEGQEGGQEGQEGGQEGQDQSMSTGDKSIGLSTTMYCPVQANEFQLDQILEEPHLYDFQESHFSCRTNKSKQRRLAEQQREQRQQRKVQFEKLRNFFDKHNQMVAENRKKKQLEKQDYLFQELKKRLDQDRQLQRLLTQRKNRQNGKVSKGNQIEMDTLVSRKNLLMTRNNVYFVQKKSNQSRGLAAMMEISDKQLEQDIQKAYQVVLSRKQTQKQSISMRDHLIKQRTDINMQIIKQLRTGRTARFKYTIAPHHIKHWQNPGNILLKKLQFQFQYYPLTQVLYTPGFIGALRLGLSDLIIKKRRPRRIPYYKAISVMGSEQQHLEFGQFSEAEWDNINLFAEQYLGFKMKRQSEFTFEVNNAIISARVLKNWPITNAFSHKPLPWDSFIQTGRRLNPQTEFLSQDEPQKMPNCQQTLMEPIIRSLHTKSLRERRVRLTSRQLKLSGEMKCQRKKIRRRTILKQWKCQREKHNQFLIKRLHLQFQKQSRQSQRDKLILEQNNRYWENKDKVKQKILIQLKKHNLQIEGAYLLEMANHHPQRALREANKLGKARGYWKTITQYLKKQHDLVRKTWRKQKEIKRNFFRNSHFSDMQQALHLQRICQNQIKIMVRQNLSQLRERMYIEEPIARYIKPVDEKPNPIIREYIDQCVQIQFSDDDDDAILGEPIAGKLILCQDDGEKEDDDNDDDQDEEDDDEEDNEEEDVTQKQRIQAEEDEEEEEEDAVIKRRAFEEEQQRRLIRFSEEQQKESLKQAKFVENGIQMAANKVYTPLLGKDRFLIKPPKWDLRGFQVLSKPLFTTPPNASINAKQFFQNQVKAFLSIKKVNFGKFRLRDNIYSHDFSPDTSHDDRSFKVLGKKDQDILDGFSTGKYVPPLKFRLVNFQIGGGFDINRAGKKGEPIAFFNGFVMTVRDGNLFGNHHNMMTYLTGQTQETSTVVTTCGNFWGLGPMFNCASKKKATMILQGAMTSRGLQYIFRLKRDLKAGQHLTWNYNSGKTRTYNEKDFLDIAAIIKAQESLTKPQTSNRKINKDEIKKQRKGIRKSSRILIIKGK